MQKNLYRNFKNLFLITIGSAIFALGFDLFLDPNQINVGGDESGASAARADLGPLPGTAVALLAGLAAVWLGIIAYVTADWAKKRKGAKG